MKTDSPSLVTRYAITHCDAEGTRRHTFASEDHYTTEQQANKALAATLANNSADKLRQLFGPYVIETLKVKPVRCYANGYVTPDGQTWGQYMIAESRGGDFVILNLDTCDPHGKPFKTRAAAIARCIKLND